ncbi:hypothetical protein C0989_002841 [Termitomyces sp. Mn162]|nr:hypothetical protein C0989_002841 [Termitomyces sp. Mn162]
MAGSKFAYVRNFELPDTLLPGTFMVFRLDGHSFHRFSDKHDFTKPNDVRALQLMDHAARDVMEEYPDILLAFGESDEFSDSTFPPTKIDRSLQSPTGKNSVYTDIAFHVYPPSFDGRIVLYPREQQIRDYFSWRQADTHINNLYNTVFWALVQLGGETTTQAHATLRGTVSKEKHEILFTRFQINYNQIDERFRKGSVLVREEVTEPAVTVNTQGSAPHGPSDASDDTLVVPAFSPFEQKRTKLKRDTKPKTEVVVLHCDIIKDQFWDDRPGILSG